MEMKEGIPGGETTGESRKRVLLVDDDPDVLRLLKRLLAPHVEVRIALDAVSGLAALREVSFDALLTDFELMGPSGAWLLQRAREIQPESRRVLFSGRSYADVAAQLEPGLVHEYLDKPVAVEGLLACICGQDPMAAESAAGELRD